MTTPAENAVQIYLQNLAQELSGAPTVAKQEALQDAEEFLRGELQLLGNGQTSSAQQTYYHFTQVFGTPAHVAAGYLEGTAGLSTDFARSGISISPQRRSTAATAVLILCTTAGVCFAVMREPPKLSPFTRVDFEDERVLVEFEGATNELVAFDDIPIQKIVNSAKQQFGDRWQKRIAEDLVEVLWGMDHRPGDQVKLHLRNPENKAEKVIAKAAMTEANRQAVWWARHLVDANRIERAQRAATERRPPKLSPFTKVDFAGGRILVEVDGKTSELVALDDIPTGKVVASAKRQFGRRWQKRVAEDLVEVLWGMGHRPGCTVKLQLRDPKTKAETVVNQACMTEANRRAVWRARNQHRVAPNSAAAKTS